MRAALGFVLVASLLDRLPVLQQLYAIDGPIPPAAAAASLPWPRVSPMDWLQSVWQIQAFMAVALSVFVGLMVGWKSRTMAVLALAFQVFIYARDPFDEHGGHRVMRLATLYMALVPCGAAFSLDRLLRKTHVEASSSFIPCIVQRMVQIQMVVIYMHSGWEKLHGSAWRSGDALYYTLSNAQYQRSPIILDAVVSSSIGQALCTLGTWTTLGWESCFGFLVLHRTTRKATLMTGVALHFGIGLTLGVGTFTWIMLWCYLSWLPDATWDQIQGRVSAHYSAWLNSRQKA